MQHMRWQRAERSAYAEVRAKAEHGDLWSISWDATASWSTRLPMSPPGIKRCSPWNGKYIETKVNMCIVHGSHRGKEYCHRVASPPWVHASGNLQLTLFLYELLPKLGDTPTYVTKHCPHSPCVGSALPPSPCVAQHCVTAHR